MKGKSLESSAASSKFNEDPSPPAEDRHEDSGSKSISADREY
jgi:hypothetical protein